MSDSLVRMESFPFDSVFDGYDDDGYPIYDRAVGASMLRAVYKQFFSDGVFEGAADSFYLQKAENGLAVRVLPGVAILQGAMGELRDELLITLSEQPPIGKTPYSIMLRYDGNIEYRSLYIRVVEGVAGTNCVPPEPEIGAEVKEIRLGYLIVPSGATDLSEAELVNEKGSVLCPYAAPFAEIDLSEVVYDAKMSADRGLARYSSRLDALIDQARTLADGDLEVFQTYVTNYLDLVRAAIDGNAVAFLESQITDLQVAYISVGEVEAMWGEASPDNEYTAMTNAEIDELFAV